jgi:hypothetical protein
VDGLAQYARPTYARSTTLSDTAALALLQEFAPVVYLSSKEKYFPASVDWYLPLVTMTYTHAVQDTPQTDVILHQVTKANINTQVSGDEFSWLIPYQDGTTTKFTAALDFRLSIIDQKTYYGQQPPPPVSPQAPFYGAVIDNPAVGATDLLYMFFYGYNGEAGIAFGGLGTHEADWEHVIIRLSADKSKIMGMYCQAHASDGAYSKWYYKSGSSGPPNFETYGASQRPIVYSAAESHASYTSAGTFNIGGPGGILGEDETDEGALWNATANVVLVSLPETNWLQFSGRWGATNDTFGKSPDPPAAQGWLVPRSDGPHGWITGPLT